jgi:formylmethanofuran dehydrogenase subunit E
LTIKEEVKKKGKSQASSSGESSTKQASCFVCGALVSEPKEDNQLGDEIICDTCQKEMISSLEEAWVKHSAFLDSALN